MEGKQKSFPPHFRAKISKGFAYDIAPALSGLCKMRTGFTQKCAGLPLGGSRLPLEKEATELPSQGFFMCLFQYVQMR